MTKKKKKCFNKVQVRDKFRSLNNVYRYCGYVNMNSVRALYTRYFFSTLHCARESVESYAERMERSTTTKKKITSRRLPEVIVSYHRNRPYMTQTLLW